MAVRRHVDGHAVQAHGEVGAVVKIEAAQEVLVGFAVAGVLGGDNARHGFHDVAGAQFRSRLEYLALGRPFAGTVGRADGGVSRASHFDFWQMAVLRHCGSSEQ